MTQIYSSTRKDVLDYLLYAAYNPYESIKRKVIRELGGGKSFHFRGEIYSPFVHRSSVSYLLTMDEREVFAKHVADWDLVEQEKESVKQHFTNYLNQCRTVADIYAIIPPYLKFTHTDESSCVMPIKRQEWFFKHELMELYLDRLFIVKLE